METSEEMGTAETAGPMVKHIEATVNSYSGALVTGDLPFP